MFKFFLEGLTESTAKASPREAWFGPFLPLSRVVLLCSLLFAGATGCRTLSPPLAPANLKEPGWTVREGQAVWQVERGTTEIAGEVLVATRVDGRAFVQFSKSPFPLVVAQSTTNRWEITFPPQDKHFAGRGQPPKRLIWLYLPRVLAGTPPPEQWTWRQTGNEWRLENRQTGESLEGFFTQ